MDPDCPDGIFFSTTASALTAPGILKSVFNAVRSTHCMRSVSSRESSWCCAYPHTHTQATPNRRDTETQSRHTTTAARIDKTLNWTLCSW